MKFAKLFSLVALLALFMSSTSFAGQREKIYDLLPNTALSGVIDPEMPDRANINKAWPKTPKDKTKIRIGWTEITMGNPWFVALEKAAKRTADQYGYDLSWQVADGDVQRQCSHIDTYVTRRVDIIVVDPTDILGVGNCINRAVKAGIPVVAIGTVPDARARILTTITPNPFKSAFAAGEVVAKDAGKDKEIIAAMIIGVVGNSTTESRLTGMASGIIHERMKQMGLSEKKEDAMLRGFNLFQSVKKKGMADDKDLKFRVVALGEGMWTEEGGLTATEDILSAHSKELNYILTGNDFMALGSIRALRNFGEQGKGIQVAACGDGNRIALDLIKKGKLLVTATHSPDQTGSATINFIHQIFEQNLDPNNLPMGSYFPAFAFYKENVDQFIEPNNDFYKYEHSPIMSIPELKALMKQQ